MGNRFVAASSRPVFSVKQFLRDSSDNSIKYRPESGKKHFVYIPYITCKDENGNDVKSIVAISKHVHEMTPAPGKYDASICLKGTEIKDENGNLINDGTCPFCDRVTDSWNIYNFELNRAVERAEKQGMTGQALEDYKKSCKSNFGRNLKIKAGKSYIYLLIAQYKMTAGNQPEIGPDGLPAFELKIMKLSEKSIQKIQQPFDNSGLQLEGSEAVFSYDVDDSPMRVAGSRTVSPIFQNTFISRYPGLKDAIDAAVAKWDWEGIESAFREWTPISTEAAKKKCDEIFADWDAYQADPSKGYLGSDAVDKTSNPSLTGPTSTPNAPTNVNVQLGGGNVPQGQAEQSQGVQMPGFGGFGGFGNGGNSNPQVDPNALFNSGMPR